MITLQNITEDNFKECLGLTATVEKECYVDPVEYSLAEAWLYGKTALPFSIYADGTMVGFVSLYIGDRQFQIINFLIDDRFQKMGYGTAAARICLDYLREQYNAKQVSVPVFLENMIALNFWKKLGFAPSETVEDGYMFLRLTL